MPNRFLPICLTALLVTGCANKTESNEPLSLAENKAHLVGIWAMVPLRNGIANVVEYKADGTALLHPFNCAEPGKPEIEESTYQVADDGQTIHISSPMDDFDLNVLEFNRKTMQLGLHIADSNLTFAYVKAQKVAPLCALYQLANLQAKATPYQQSDFIPAPLVPAHQDLGRYIGKWATAEGDVQVEVRRSADGSALIYQASNENWRQLFNAVHWVGDELHYQKYAYSEKESLYRHPYHKSQHAKILKALPDGTMMDSFFIGGTRHDMVLKRISD
ncbi:hypothetical protein KXR94_20440 [Stutzerimonas stutzeri]